MFVLNEVKLGQHAMTLEQKRVHIPQDMNKRRARTFRFPAAVVLHLPRAMRVGAGMIDTKAFAELERREGSNADAARSYACGFAQASEMVVPQLTHAVCAAHGKAGFKQERCRFGRRDGAPWACACSVATGVDRSHRRRHRARPAVGRGMGGLSSF
jgi:hypothetical protein